MRVEHRIPLAALGTALSVVLATGAAAQPRDCADILAADPQLSRTASAFRRTGMLDTLRSPGTFTVFAPTDQAIARHPSDLFERLFPQAGSDQGGPDMDLVDALAAVNSHISEGRRSASEFRAGEKLRTRNGTTIDVMSVGGSQTALRATAASATIGTEPRSARIVEADIPCSNGVVHKIDGVLLR